MSIYEMSPEELDAYLDDCERDELAYAEEQEEEECPPTLPSGE